MAEKIGNLIRSSTFSDAATLRSDRTAPSWDHNAGATEPARNPEAALRSNDVQDAYSQVGSREMASPREPQHLRSPSGVTGAASSTEYTDSQHNRRHDYDVQAMESDLSPRPASAFTHAIPAPTVTIRSEFPTLNRSRQQQPLTCLITVEVPEGSWQPGSEDLPQIPETSSHVQIPREDPYMDKRHLSLLDARSIPYEPQENLDEIAEDLRTRVDNWHGLEFDRYVYRHCLVSFVLPTAFPANTCLDLENFACTASCVWARMATPGRNYNPIYLMKCSFASKKGSMLLNNNNTIIITMTSDCRVASAGDARSKALF